MKTKIALKFERKFRLSFITRQNNDKICVRFAECANLMCELLFMFDFMIRQVPFLFCLNHKVHRLNHRLGIQAHLYLCLAIWIQGFYPLDL